MSDNLDELKGLVAAIAAERQAIKDKEKRESWTKYVSLSMIVLAVLAAIATQRGAGYSSATMKQLNEATFNQTSASDQWAFYQAKGIKESVYSQELDSLTAMGKADPKLTAAITSRVERYKKEQKDIFAEAKKFEEKRDEARKAADHAATLAREMGLGTTVFQIAIALGGVTLVVKKRALWTVSLLIGLAATAQMIRVLWLM